ncbi:MAG TPA: AIR synthase related protein [Syntrophorhabdaceae bacterium]|nr:AIR synthase related protein [Syntrophorhabdaceae bacterium]
MKEHEWIGLITHGLKRDARQRNRLFECDAEILEMNGQLWALTLDQFSPEEDMFSSEEPEILGANLATATISDLFAAGAMPEFFLQGLTICHSADKVFVRRLAQGIVSVLSSVGCALCGGDLGEAEQWRFSGFAMGRVRDNKPLSRILPERSHSIWVTGNFGDANLAVLEKGPTPVFEVRNREAQVIHKYGTACIDTSGGLVDALWWLHTLNPDTRFEIDLNRIPLASGVREAGKAEVPIEAFLLGGAGEYELLFSVPEPITSEIQDALQTIQTIRIGEVYPRSHAGLYFRKQGVVVSRMETEPPCPRENLNREAYIQSVLSVARKLAGE